MGLAFSFQPSAFSYQRPGGGRLGGGRVSDEGGEWKAGGRDGWGAGGAIARLAILLEKPRMWDRMGAAGGTGCATHEDGVSAVGRDSGQSLPANLTR